MTWIDRPQGKVVDGKIVSAPGGIARDSEDFQRFRHARERHEGFPIGQYMQTPPLFFTRDRHTLWLGDLYRGSPAFLVLSGPSFLKINRDLLRQAGILTMGVNNSVRTFRPNLWVEVDNPQNFMSSIWLDPLILKFAPHCHAEKKIFDNVNWCEMNVRVGDCPAVIFYHRNEHFNHAQYLYEDTINWGCHKDIPGSCGIKGCRSVLLAALRILYAVGIRTVFLLGADFRMEAGGQNYSFEQNRSRGSIKNNNNTYAALNKRFDLLRPVFEKHEYHVFNCNEESGLKSFPYVSYTDALTFCTSRLPDVSTERTAGLYERAAEAKKADDAAKAQKAKQTSKTIDDFIGEMGAEENE